MNCIICNKEIAKSMFSHKPLCSYKCFNIDFWNDCLNDTAIIINGNCYHDGGNTLCGGSLGYDGRLIRIQMNDGRIIETNNLRFNGEVPKDRNVKDNAIFI